MKIFDVKWSIDTAGPSPYCNERTELFLYGCQKAVNGNPCKGCFNYMTWDSSNAIKTYLPKEVASNILKFASNKYITIGGGEPTDQIEELLKLVRILKIDDFHIMMYTWRSLKDEFNNDTQFSRLLKQLIFFVDIIVDGEFKQEECLYSEEKGDGFLNSIGSGNQIIWDCKEFIKTGVLNGFCMKDLEAIALNSNNDLIYLLKDINTKEENIKLY